MSKMFAYYGAPRCTRCSSPRGPLAGPSRLLTAYPGGVSAPFISLCFQFHPGNFSR
ncbi:hypothetical protein B0H67DRAFT_594061 [Lasiosphaeris hirsuta]|uniref:Uncharacterized protein n=1 Tax=Lasiosphaeris hirsuta TaxID=260670 RepID=A0AA39ZXF9_9PEZI|nr:hypothetical protein B0H67DRAFT_594061 [Lasiosphaeris hirsuta]